MDGEDSSHVCMKIMNMEEPEEFTGFFIHTLCRITALQAKKERQQCAKCFPKYLLCPYNDCKL